MAYVAYGFKTITHTGTVAGAAGSMRQLHTYVTNDDAATVETDEYFDVIAARFKTGDMLFCALDIDGTPTVRIYVVTSASGDVTLSRETTAVTGDQTAIDALTGTLTGTVDDAMEDVADIALSTSDTYTDAAVNSAVNVAILATNLQLKELQTKVNALIAAMEASGLTVAA